MPANWKTTLGGFMGAAGFALVHVTAPAWCPAVGAAMTALAIAFLGYHATDAKAEPSK